jgi:hypothetical protein
MVLDTKFIRNVNKHALYRKACFVCLVCATVIAMTTCMLIFEVAFWYLVTLSVLFVISVIGIIVTFRKYTYYGNAIEALPLAEDRKEEQSSKKVDTDVLETRSKAFWDERQKMSPLDRAMFVEGTSKLSLFILMRKNDR